MDAAGSGPPISYDAAMQAPRVADGSSAAGHRSLVGRGPESRRVEQVVDAARGGRSGVLVVRGQAGMGKTALLEHACAHGDGMTTLRASGYESESEMPFAGLFDLLRPVLDGVDDLPRPQAAALAGALAIGPPVEADRFTVCAATLSLLAAASTGTRLLVVVDDLQWLDTSSRQALLFAARRLHAEGIALLLASRRPEDRDLDYAGLEQLELSGLDPDAAKDLLAAANLSATAVRQLHEATGGNPMAMLEVASLMGPAVLTGQAPLPVGANLEAALHRRIADLPEPTRQALLVAAASETAALATLQAALGRMDLDLHALAPAEVADVVRITGERVLFAHPLLRSVAYHRAPALYRRQAHLALADAFAAQDGERAADQRAWHLGAGWLQPDDEVADLLAEAGRRARRRGAYPAAALAFSQAARLAEDREHRARHLQRAAQAGHMSGAVQQAEEYLAQALDLTRDPVTRAGIQHRRGFVQMWRQAPPQARELLLREAAQVADRDPGRAMRMRTDAAVPALMAGELPLALEAVEQAEAEARAVPLEPPAFTRVIHAVCLATLGRRREATAALAELEGWRAAAHPVRDAQELLFIALVHVWHERYEEAGAVLRTVVDTTRRASALGALPYALGIACELDYRLGRWSPAAAAATESIRLADETGQRNAYARYYLARLQAARGEEDACLDNLEATRQRAHRYDIRCLHTYIESGHGLLALGLGRPEEAVTALERAAALADQQGLGEPAVVQWEPNLVEALIRTGRVDEAQQRLRAFAARVDPDTQRWAAGGVERCRGLLADDDAFAGHFATAVQLHEPTPFEQARTRLCLGERLRRNRQRADARGPLSDALAAFERLGAGAWADRTRAELEATGAAARSAGPSAASGLTPQELQVALTVSTGATNAEAAASLFLSPKTVEYHLTHVYRKLGVSSRTELAEVMAAS